MKTRIVSGVFQGGEIEPGVFHAHAPVRPDANPVPRDPDEEPGDDAEADQSAD